jgi:N-acyl-D-amino-acid deacylase
LIASALVVDGSGTAGYTADVRLLGDRIGEIGKLDARPSETVVDGSGLALAPGFIDPHSHADSSISDHLDALAAVSQGITTVIGGQDGGSELPLASFYARLEAEPAAVNLASYVGHGTLRHEVMGDDFERPATDEEVEHMRELLATEMASGALGLASGLEYDPGIYSTTDEVVALAREAATHGGRYISHIRSEDRHFWEAIDEILTIGREAEIPVQISHVKLALRSLHGQAERLLAVLDAARAAGVEVTADIYPYTYWQSTLTVMFPDRDFESLEAARFAVEELAAPEEMLIPVFAPEPTLAGKTLAEIAEERGADAATTLIELIREAETWRRSREAATGEGTDADEDDLENIESVIAVSMAEADVERLMRWPFISICTDGELDGAHPRGFGSFPRVLGRYVRERGALTLEQAVHRMTGRTADSLGLPDRGRVATGFFADLVLFDPRTVMDRATTDDPHAMSEGVVAVWVNGQPVFERGRPTGHRPGRVLRRP